MNNYLKNKLLFKLNIDILLKKKNNEKDVNFDNVNFFSLKFIKFLKLLLIDFKFKSFINIFFATILNYYNQFVFIEFNSKLVGYAFMQKKKKKYFFMKKNDSMLGAIYVSKNFRNRGFATILSLYLLKKTSKFYDNIFYVSNNNNKASIKLAKKCGFKSYEYKNSFF
jgi:ribosomal protein S18 acetylase RimI-like enzyme